MRIGDVRSLHGDGDIHVWVNRAGDVVCARRAKGDVFRRAGIECHARAMQLGWSCGVGVADAILADAQHVSAAGILRVNHV